MSEPVGNPYDYTGSTAYASTAALAEEWERAVFIRRTYAHLAAAVALFVGIEAVVFNLVPPETMGRVVGTMFNGWNWLIVLGAFLGVGWLARSWAMSATSVAAQYAGLCLYVIAQAIIFLPLLFLAYRVAPEAVPTAALMTGVIFGGMTLLVFATKSDFSWLGKYLCLAGLVAMGLIVCSIFIGFSLGMLFSGLMIALAAGYILYDTSNILHHYRTEQYVAASLALFASVALLFWYVLRFAIALSGRD